MRPRPGSAAPGMFSPPRDRPQWPPATAGPSPPGRRPPRRARAPPPGRRKRRAVPAGPAPAPTHFARGVGNPGQYERNLCRTRCDRTTGRQIIRRHDAIAVSTCAGFSGLDTKMVLWSRGKGPARHGRRDGAGAGGTGDAGGGAAEPAVTALVPLHLGWAFSPVSDTVTIPGDVPAGTTGRAGAGAEPAGGVGTRRRAHRTLGRRAAGRYGCRCPRAGGPACS